MHYRWEGAQGGLVAPPEACVLGGGREEEVPQPSPTVGGADTRLRLRGGGWGHKVSIPEGPSSQALPRAEAHRAGWGTLWMQSCATLPLPLWWGRGRLWAGPSSYPVLPHPILGRSERLWRLLEDEAWHASVFMMLAMFLQSSMPLWGRPVYCRLRPLFMSRSPFLGQ